LDEQVQELRGERDETRNSKMMIKDPISNPERSRKAKEEEGGARNKRGGGTGGS